MKFQKSHSLGLMLLAAGIATACGSSGSDSPAGAVGALPSQTGPVSIPKGSRSFATDALLFNGAGTWSTEVTQLRSIFTAHGVTYQEVSSSQLNAMSTDELAQFGMIVWPGGYGSTQTSSLTTATKDHVREAVQVRGVNYIGFCAGAFVAVNPMPAPGTDPDYGIAIVPGPMLKYYALEAGFEKSGKIDLAMTQQSFADGTQRDIVWYGGPMTPNVLGGVVSKYPDGTPAISQIWSGNGFVMLSGGHPTAPQALRDQFGLQDSDGEDLDIAWKLLDATLHQHELPAF